MLGRPSSYPRTRVTHTHEQHKGKRSHYIRERLAIVITIHRHIHTHIRTYLMSARPAKVHTLCSYPRTRVTHTQKQHKGKRSQYIRQRLAIVITDHAHSHTHVCAYDYIDSYTHTHTLPLHPSPRMLERHSFRLQPSVIPHTWITWLDSLSHTHTHTCGRDESVITHTHKRLTAA